MGILYERDEIYVLMKFYAIKFAQSIEERLNH